MNTDTPVPVAFTLGEWSQVINLLAQGPYGAVAPIIHGIQAQCAAQQAPHNVVPFGEAS